MIDVDEAAHAGGQSEEEQARVLAQGGTVACEKQPLQRRHAGVRGRVGQRIGKAANRSFFLKAKRLLGVHTGSVQLGFQNKQRKTTPL